MISIYPHPGSRPSPLHHHSTPQTRTSSTPSQPCASAFTLHNPVRVRSPTNLINSKHEQLNYILDSDLSFSFFFLSSIAMASTLLAAMANLVTLSRWRRLASGASERREPMARLVPPRRPSFSSDLRCFAGPSSQSCGSPVVETCSLLRAGPSGRAVHCGGFALRTPKRRAVARVLSEPEEDPWSLEPSAVGIPIKSKVMSGFVRLVGGRTHLV